ncbi:endonuclease [Shewanella phage Thanatos-2]|nr:endonuclease [Shewanella phage Thanatos-2]
MLLVGKKYQEEKQIRFVQQNGLCLLCGRPLNEDVQKNHLDHDHELEGNKAGKVRGLLCNLCNAYEGQVKHKFSRSGLKGAQVDYISWLKNLIDYLESDYSLSPIHPQYVNDMTKKFKAMTRPEMEEEFKRIGYEYKDGTKAVLLSQYKKALKKFLCK